MASEFKCTKAIFIPTRIHRRESDLYNEFIDYYGYDIYTREKPLLNDIYDYVKKSSEKGKSKSFCSKDIGVGVTNTYLPNYIRDIIRGNDVETTIMCCYNKDNSQPYSILLYKYDEEKNSIYIETVCADQTTGEESKGSGYLLIKNLVDDVNFNGCLHEDPDLFVYARKEEPLMKKIREKEINIRTDIESVNFMNSIIILTKNNFFDGA